MIGSTSAIASRLDTKVVVPLKYLGNFWRSLDLPLSNCEIELDLTWSKDFVIYEILRTAAVAGDNPVGATETTEEIFQLNSVIRYIPVVTFIYKQ